MFARLRKFFGKKMGFYQVRRTFRWSRRRVMVYQKGEDCCYVESPVEDDGMLSYTAEELAAMTIRCAWCGTRIVIGEPISLFALKKGCQVPEYAVPFGKDPVRYIGCMQMSCDLPGLGRDGFWIPDPDHHGKGKVKPVMSPVQAAMKRKSGIVIVPNVDSQADAESV